MTESIEIWKSIPGYESYYEASSLGNIRSLDRFVKNGKHGVIKRTGQLKKAVINHKGYLRINLNKEGVNKKHNVHTLVAITFLGFPPSSISCSSEGYTVNHKDGNKLNNSSENLEWLSNAANNHHAAILKLKARGERSGKSKLTTEQVLNIKSLRQQGFTEVRISELTGVSRNTIHSILAGKSWKEVS